MGSRAAPFAIATLVAGPALLILGAVLKATTHHRALGGTTFAVVALFVGAGALALGARAGGIVGRWADASPARVRVVTIGSGLLVLTVLGALSVVAARTPTPTASEGAATEPGGAPP